MSDAGVPLDTIAHLVGHRSTAVTETVYRKQLRPVLTSGAEVIDTGLNVLVTQLVTQEPNRRCMR